jgi:hypothetical protein
MRLLDALADEYGQVLISRRDLAELLSVSIRWIREALATAEFLRDLRYLTPKECRMAGFPHQGEGHYDDEIGLGIQLVYRAHTTQVGRAWLRAEGKEGRSEPGKPLP